VQLVAVCDVVEDAARACAAGAGVDAVYTDARELLARDDIAAVDICTPHDQHLPLAIAAAEAGKHVLLEKPMANSLDECRAIVAAAEQSGVTLMVAQHLRHHPGYVAVRNLIKAGELGRIWSANSQNWLQAAIAGAARPGRTDYWGFDGKRGGGGVVTLLSTHHIDLFRYFFGDVRSVFGHAWTDHPLFTNGAEDRAVFTLEFEGGVVAQYSASLSTRVPYGHQFMIFGDQGTVHTEPPLEGNAIQQHQAPPFVASATRAAAGQTGFAPVEPATEGLACEDPFVNEIVHFSRCCREGKEPVSSGRDNLRTMKAVFGVYESARTGRIVELKDL